MAAEAAHEDVGPQEDVLQLGGALIEAVMSIGQMRLACMSTQQAKCNQGSAILPAHICTLTKGHGACHAILTGHGAYQSTLSRQQILCMKSSCYTLEGCTEAFTYKPMCVAYNACLELGTL